MAEIVIADSKIPLDLLRRLCDAWFGDMVKIVVDVKREVIGLGGFLQADAESLLIDSGSEQKYIWGANIYPYNDLPDQRIEYSALINIRPHQDNPSMEIADDDIKLKVKNLVEKYIINPDETMV